MRIVRVIAGLAAWILLICLFAPSVSALGVRDFLPHVTGYTAGLDVDGSYESHNEQIGEDKTKRSDAFFREMLYFKTSGFIYHPRFVLFAAQISGGLKEEQYKSGGNVAPWRFFGAWEYDLRALALPKHPYNLELFTTRIEPLSKGVLSSSFQTVSYNSGAVARYKKKPYYLDLHYFRNTTESKTAKYSTDKYGLLANYHKDLLQGNNYTAALAFDRQTSSALGTRAASDDFGLSAGFRYNILRASTSITYHDFGQHTPAIGLKTSGKTIAWMGHEAVSLPWNFAIDASQNLSKTTFHVGGSNITDQSLSATNKYAAFSITHQLYQSLLSKYTGAYAATNFDEGSSTTFSNNFGFAYSKRIPGGFLRADMGFGNSDINTTGPQNIPSEAHDGHWVPFGTFLLDKDGAQRDSILVFVKSVLVTGELVFLTEGMHYRVDPVGATFRVTIFALPPEFPIPGTYDFVVSYTVRDQKAERKVSSLSYSVRLELFGDKVVPYWNHDERDDKVVKGVSDIPESKVTTDTWGLLLQLGRLRLAGRYSEVKTPSSPSKGWTAQADYNDTFFKYTRLQSTVIYSNTRYPEGIAGVQGGERAYTETVFSSSVGLQQRIPQLNFFIYIGGGYSEEKGIGKSTSYAGFSNLSWGRGRLYLELGANLSKSKSEINDVTSRRTDQYYFLRVKRKFF